MFQNVLEFQHSTMWFWDFATVEPSKGPQKANDRLNGTSFPCYMILRMYCSQKGSARGQQVFNSTITKVNLHAHVMLTFKNPPSL